MDLFFNRKKLKASVTVEASLVMCIVLFAMATVIKGAFVLCENVKTAAVCEMEEYHPVRLLHMKKMVDEMGKKE